MPRSVIAALQVRVLRVRDSYLFVPAAIAAALAAAAAVLLWLDSTGGNEGLVQVLPSGAAGSRTVLSVIAGSLITVAGVSFSIMIVTLQLVSQQYTPRALRNFLGDRINQLVAGVYVGVFLYCLVVLSAIDEGATPFVPGLSLAVAFALAIVALGMLLVFIDHMAISIQVSEIANRIARATLSATKDLYPAPHGEPIEAAADALVETWMRDGEPAIVYPRRPGFVQSVDDIPHTLGGRGFRMLLYVRPGDFVTENDALAAVWTDAGGEACCTAVRRAIAIGTGRDIRQDVAYGIQQLADIAIKALSPSVNDPTTATTCIGYLQAILERLAATEPPSPVRGFKGQGVTLILPRHEPRAYVEALLQVSRDADDARVGDALLRACTRVGQAAVLSGAADWADAVDDATARIRTRLLASSKLDQPEREHFSRAR